MIDLHNRRLFTPCIDPESGVPMYVLTRRVAPVQEAFYFVNDGASADGRYLWFYCAYPPSGSAAQGRTLGVLDSHAGEVRHFAETQFNEATPFVDPDSGEVYWGTGLAVWRRGPGVGDAAQRVNGLPAEMVGSRHVHRLATHLTRSADGREFFIDAAFGLRWIMGSLPVDGGDFQFWHRFDRNYNHAQFSPTDRDVVLFAQENHSDPITGMRFAIVDRVWLIERGGQPHPLFDTPTRLTHEWWDPDGQHAWAVQFTEAVWRTDIRTQEVEAIHWPGIWHAHSSRSGAYLVGDVTTRFYRGCPSTVEFLNRDTGRKVRVAANPEMPGLTGSAYHIDPHPRFCCGDELVVFTTTVLGEVDLAVARTADLLERTG